MSLACATIRAAFFPATQLFLSSIVRIVIAPQEFKGTLSAAEAAGAMSAGAAKAMPAAEIDEIPLSDGGPGIQDVILAARGGKVMTATVHDPMGRKIQAKWGLLHDGSAVIEMAAAAGLWRVTADERDPLTATTYGVGELILEALNHECSRIIVGLGGSVTNDGGAGMASALGARLLDDLGSELAAGGAALVRLDRIDATDLDPRLNDTEVIAATDVRNPLCGPEGASLVYGEQKGASGEQAIELDAALKRYASVVKRDLGIEIIDMPGAGAAGGLGAGLIAFTGAKVRPGFDVVAEIVGLRERIRGADMVVTGEGRLDAQTRFGKTVAGVTAIAHELDVPVIVVPGSVGDGWESLSPSTAIIEPVVGETTTLDEALAHPSKTLTLAVERAVRTSFER